MYCTKDYFNIGFPAQFRQNCIQFNDTFIQFRAKLNDLRDQHSKVYIIHSI